MGMLLRWMWGMIWRTLVFGGLWFGLAFIAAMVIVMFGGAEPGPLLFRLSFLITAGLLILWESGFTHANLWRLQTVLDHEAAVSDIQEQAPDSEPESHDTADAADSADTPGPSVWVPPTWLVALSCVLVMRAGSAFDVMRSLGGLGLALIFAVLGGALLAMMVWRLVWTFRWGWRELVLTYNVLRTPNLRLPPLWTTFPLISGTIATFCWAFAIFMPRSVLLEGMDEVDETPFWADRDAGETELLLELGEDDHILEVLFGIWMHDGEVQKLISSGPWDSDPNLGQTWVVSVPDSKLDALVAHLEADDENVDAIELNSAIRVSSLSGWQRCEQRGWRTLMPGSYDDPLQGRTDDLSQLDIPSFTSAVGGRSYTPVHLAIVDAGVASSHEDLRPAMASRSFSSPSRHHGTAMAGAAAAVSSNGVGIASPNVQGNLIRIVDVPALDEAGGSADDVAAGILDAIEDGAKVINMSFGSRSRPPRAVQWSIQEALEADVLLVASGGNGGLAISGLGTSQWPASISGVITVGALDTYGNRSLDSSGLADVWAPGEDICVPIDGSNGYALETGTSVASARVAGVFAALRAVCPRASVKDWHDLLRHHSRISADALYRDLRLMGRCD